MTPEEVDAFVDALIRSGDRFPLDSLSPGQLRALGGFYGCPDAVLIDGHVLAWIAARRAADRHRKR